MERRDFWSEVFAIHGSVTPFVHRRVLVFGLWGALVWGSASYFGVETHLGVAPYEIIGVVLALLLVIRTNSGYDRWYEGRKLWGGIVNQSRNLGLIAVSYGPQDRTWRNAFLRWTVAFPQLARHCLRDERDLSDLEGVLEPHEIRQLEKADHPPMLASLQIARLLTQARERGEMDGFAFLRADDQRAQLIDHIGACERILRTPLARVVSIKIRRFLLIYLASLPLAIVDRTGMVTPFLTMLVAYPLLSLDQIGIELENPFSATRLSHLPLETIGSTIHRNVLAIENAPEFDSVERSERGLESGLLETEVVLASSNGRRAS